MPNSSVGFRVGGKQWRISPSCSSPYTRRRLSCKNAFSSSTFIDISFVFQRHPTKAFQHQSNPIVARWCAGALVGGHEPWFEAVFIIRYAVPKITSTHVLSGALEELLLPNRRERERHSTADRVHSLNKGLVYTGMTVNWRKRSSTVPYSDMGSRGKDNPDALVRVLCKM